MLPEIGASELLVIAVVALIVVGPKDLPLLMRRVGQFMARLRGMAAEFRASFDEMARQSELEELRKEVAALRRGEPLEPIRQELEPTMRAIESDIREYGSSYAADTTWAPRADEYSPLPPLAPADEAPHDASRDAPPPELDVSTGPASPTNEVAPEPAPTVVDPDPEPKPKRRSRARKADGESAA